MAQDMTPRKDNWYAPPAPPAPPAAPSGRTDGGYTRPAGPAPSPARSSGRSKAAWIAVCAVLVCLALAAAVWQGVIWGRRLRELPAGGSAALPSLPESGENDSVPPEFFEDFRDYFDQYYTRSDEILLPQAETGSGVTLTLRTRSKKELSLQEIYDMVSPAVVGITTYVDGTSFGWGTGVVFSPDGYIVTNTHVLQSCDSATVMFADGRQLDASLVGADTASDIAVIHVDAQDLPCAVFGQSDQMKVGDEAVAIGNPLGEAYAGTMTNGIISAIDRNVVYNGHSMTLLQTNAALNEGNSGGPLINSAGQVIGITNMKIMHSYDATVEGIGFAIPSSVVKQIADQLLEQGVVSGEPTIGIVAGAVSAEAREVYGLPQGIYVTEVNEGSDALEKGLREGDVITAVNGRSVASVAEVNFIKEGLQVGDTIILTVYRDGETFEMEVALVDKGDIG